MLPKVAYISENPTRPERRGALRRTVRLGMDGSSAVTGRRAIILDLSETGLRLQCHALPSIGDVILVDLPLIGEVPARVVWQNAGQCGAEFLGTVSKAAVSAAILVSPPQPYSAGGLARGIQARDIELAPIRSEWPLVALVPFVLLLLFALAFLPVSGF
jgi:hypothetical protein